jgi:hypothetical protein
LRARSVSRQTRATTVVSQPRRLAISAASARLRRSHASCNGVVGLAGGAQHP